MIEKRLLNGIIGLFVSAEYCACAFHTIGFLRANPRDHFGGVAIAFGVVLTVHMTLGALAAIVTGLNLSNERGVARSTAVTGALLSGLLTLPAPLLLMALTNWLMDGPLHELVRAFNLGGLAVACLPVSYVVGLILPSYLIAHTIRKMAT